jgi:ferredoxin
MSEGRSRLSEQSRVEVDRGVCIGSGECLRLAPATFSQDDDGIVVLGDPEATDIEVLRAAERSCPSGAITVRS